MLGIAVAIAIAAAAAASADNVSRDCDANSDITVCLSDLLILIRKCILLKFFVNGVVFVVIFIAFAPRHARYSKMLSM